MTPAYTILMRIHRCVDACRVQIANERGLLWWLDRATKHDDSSPHPDDAAELVALMEGDANTLREMAETLRELAYKLEMRQIEIKRNVLQYQTEAAE